LHEQVAAEQMHGHRAGSPAVRERRGGGGDGARAGRESLAGAALPDTDRELVRAVDPDELDIRAGRKACMPPDARPEPAHLATLGLATEDSMRVPDGHGREVDALVVERERLGLPHFDCSDVKLDEAVVAHERLDLSRPE